MIWVVWAVCLIAVAVLALLNVPIWVSAIVMVVWTYFWARWFINWIQGIIYDLT